jgi:hypothetical protein
VRTSLCDEAKYGQILISLRVRHAIEAAVTVEPVGEFALRVFSIAIRAGDGTLRRRSSTSSRPGGNATGINFFNGEVIAKRLRLLQDLVPKAVRVAVLVNPTNAASAKSQLREVQEAAPTIGCKSRSSMPESVRQARALLELV